MSIHDRIRSTDRGKQWLVLAGIVAVALLIRLWGIDNGLPYAQMPDESGDIATSLKIAAGIPPRYTFHRVGWPVAQLPVHAAHYIYLAVSEPGFDFGDFESRYFTQRAAFVLSIRLLVAVLTSLSTLAGYFLGRSAAGSDTGGYITAVLLATHPWYTYISHTALPDGFALVWIVMTLTCAVYIYQTGKQWAYILAGVGTAITVLARLQAFTIFIPVGIAHILYWWKQSGRPLKLLFTRWLWSLGPFVVTSILFNPFIMIDWKGSLADVWFITGQYGGDSPLSAQLIYAMQNIDLPVIVARPYFVAAAAAGLMIALVHRNREILICMLFAILFALSILPRAYPTPNFFLPFTIPVVLTAGYTVTEMSRSRKRWIKAGSILIALTLGSASLGESILVDRALSADNTRMEAYEWVVQNIPVDAAILIGEPYTYSIPLERNIDSLQRLSQHRPLSPSEQFIIENPQLARNPRFNLFGPEYQREITDDNTWWQFVQVNDIEYIIEADYCFGPFRYDSVSPIEFPVLSEEVSSELVQLATFSPFASDTCEQNIPERLHLQGMKLRGWRHVGPLIRIYRVPSLSN